MKALFVLALAVVAVGCTRRVENPDEIRKGDVPAEEYYPLAVGNAWTYHVKALGQETDQTVSIESAADGFFQQRLDPAPPGTPKIQLSVDAWGVRDDKRYLLRDPVAVGEGWTNVISVSTVERYKIIEAGQSCSVPAGTFPNCARVEARNRIDAQNTLVNEMTFARNVGIVRISVILERADGQKIPQTTLELTKFELKGGSK